MGFPFQVSESDIKKKDEDKDKDFDKEVMDDTMASQESLCEEPCEEPESCKPPKSEPCEEFLPDFCGIFDRAMAPFCPTPAININITLNLGDKDCDEDQMRPEKPHAVSFLRDKE